MLSTRLSGLREDKPVTYLYLLPQDLTIFEVLQVILIFVARQFLAIFGAGNKFEVNPGSASHGETYFLPDLRVSMGFKLSKDVLTRYVKAIGLPGGGPNTVFNCSDQMCLMLAAFTEPAFLLLLAHSKSPVRPLGSVNVRNSFELLRPDLCNAEMLLGKKNFAIDARLLRETRKVKRGLEIDIRVDLLEAGSNEVVFRQVFTMLQFMKFKKAPAVKPPVKEDDWSVSKDDATFVTRGDLTMAWASICKDYNPIHVSDLAAKAFGFPRRIVHGNHAFALGVSAIKRTLPNVEATDLKKCSVSVKFLRPVTIPSKMQVQAKFVKEGETTYKSFANSKVSIIGSVEMY